MNIKVFQSDKGDCILLGSSGRHVLVDGGMAASFAEHVAPALAEMRIAGHRLDKVCVTHIDEDHIAGILSLLEAHVQWKVHDFQHASGNPSFPEPDLPRMPEIGGFWHNSFSDMVGENAVGISEMLASRAALFHLSTLPEAGGIADDYSMLATSVRQAIELRHRISAEQLGIPVNEPADGKLMLLRGRNAAPAKVGKMEFYIIGPAQEDLERLRDEWDDWLRNHTASLAGLQREMARDEGDMGNSVGTGSWFPAAQALDAALKLELDAEIEMRKASSGLGKRSKVTEANLASLMFLVVERTRTRERTVLMTGDGHHLDILRGLEHINRLDQDGNIHVNVLKVQHHGSEHNLDEEFCRRVTADDYLFCGNGKHANPDLRVLQAILDSRIGGPQQLSTNPAAGGPFRFWFNSHHSIVENQEAAEHMQLVEQMMDAVQAANPARFSCEFLTGPFLELAVR